MPTAPLIRGGVVLDQKGGFLGEDEFPPAELNVQTLDLRGLRLLAIEVTHATDRPVEYEFKTKSRSDNCSLLQHGTGMTASQYGRRFANSVIPLAGGGSHLWVAQVDLDPNVTWASTSLTLRFRGWVIPRKHRLPDVQKSRTEISLA